MSQKRYRKNVAAVVVNDKGQLLACQRSDEFATWQLPQGGIDAGESPEQAVLRELEEEIGTAAVALIGQLPHSIRYDWPKEFVPGFQGQEQMYFLFRLNPNAQIDLNANPPIEFCAYRWVSVDEFLALTAGFKKEAYTAALLQLKETFPAAFC